MLFTYARFQNCSLHIAYTQEQPTPKVAKLNVQREETNNVNLKQLI